MGVQRDDWRTQAMLWPMISGAVYGVWTAWQFSAPDVVSRLAGSVLGAVCSLPVGAVLGGIAIAIGHVVLSFVPQGATERELVRWRLAFGAATGLAVMLAVGIALMWIGAGIAAAGVVGAIALAASYGYCPVASFATLDVSDHLA